MYSKKEFIKAAKHDAKKKHQKIIIEDDDRTVKLFIRDSSYQKLDEVVQFDDRNAQTNYTLIANCDSCFQKNLSEVLHYKGFKWQQLNDSTYLSRYYLKRVLYIHPSQSSFEIIKSISNRNEYNELRKTAKK